MTQPSLSQSAVSSTLPDIPGGHLPYFFDPREALLSQYARSPIILALVEAFEQWFDPNLRFDLWFSQVRDIDSAAGYGLDVWGRILGVSRILQVPTAAFLGFSSDPYAETFGNGIFFTGIAGTNAVRLLDDAYRVLLLAKAAFNITDCSIPAINALLLELFGQGYVVDNLNMSMVYHFDSVLTPVQQAIIYQSGAVPKPAGVSFTVSHP